MTKDQPDNNPETTEDATEVTAINEDATEIVETPIESVPVETVEWPGAVPEPTADKPGSGKLGWVAAALLAVLFLASAGAAGTLYFTKYRTDQLVGERAQQAALNAASTGSVAMLSYSPDTLDADFATARSHLTGDFLSYYSDFTQSIVTRAAQQKSVSTSAAVVRRALVNIEPDSATVLIFLNQTTASKDNPDGSFTTSSVKVGLERHDDTWLISSFDPV